MHWAGGNIHTSSPLSLRSRGLHELARRPDRGGALFANRAALVVAFVTWLIAAGVSAHPDSWRARGGDGHADLYGARACDPGARDMESPDSGVGESYRDWRRQVLSRYLALGRCVRRPRCPGGDGDLVADHLVVGGDAFTYNSSVHPKLIVHDESRSPTTMASFKYSDGFANHTAQGRARGSIGSPLDVRNNDIVAQYNGQGYLDGKFTKVAAVNMQVDPSRDLDDGMSGQLVFKVANEGRFVPAMVLDSRRRTRFRGTLLFGQDTHVVEEDRDDIELGQEKALVQRFATEGSRSISGFWGDEGEVIVIINVGDGRLTLANRSERSLPQNRIVTGTGADLVLEPDETATIFYDEASERWRVLSTTGS